MKIELTVEEANSLANLLDIAVKSDGLKVANFALFILRKIEDAAKVEQEEVKGK